MRPAMIAMVLSVLATSLFWSPCAAGRSRLTALVGEKPTPGKWTVEGVGETQDEAQTKALEKARDRIVEYLSEREGGLTVPLTLDNVRQLNVTRFAGKEEFDLPRSGHSVRVSLEVELTPDALVKIQELAHKQRMVERQRLAARGLGGILAVLLVVFGYLRLEEATKGYHTTLLRLAALAVLVTAGLSLWWLG